MRIERIRGDGSRELGEVDLEPGSGLVGWAGGTARDRRRFVELLCRALEIRGRGQGRTPAGEGSRPATSSSGRPDPGPEGDGSDASVDSRASMEWVGTSGSPQSGAALDGVEVEVSVEGELVRLRCGPATDGPEDGRKVLRARLGLAPEAFAFVWNGGGWIEPEPLWEAGVHLLASRRGLARLDQGLARLGVAPTAAEGPERSGAEFRREAPPEVEAELDAVEARLEALADVPDRLRSLEDELRSLRADAAEVVGELEVATMDWLRERQDAETHLQQYRDQARELRARMRELEEKGPEGSCPFCGSALGDHLDEVMAEFEEEWDALVQDGSWWRRRRDQLELKPDDLQELERRSVQLQADVEECAERLERCRFELREWDELRGRREELLALVGENRGDRVDESIDERSSGAGSSREVTGSSSGPDRLEEGSPVGRRRRTLIRAFRSARDELLRETRRDLTRSAGSLLNRISGGRILGLVDDKDGRLGVVEDGRVVRGGVEDRAGVALALHLALALRMMECGVPLESILVGEVLRGMDPESRIRSVEVLRGLGDRIPQILLVSGGEVVDAVPERFDHILEFRAERDRPSLRRVPGGVGRLGVRVGEAEREQSHRAD